MAFPPLLHHEEQSGEAILSFSPNVTFEVYSRVRLPRIYAINLHNNTQMRYIENRLRRKKNLECLPLLQI